MYLIIPAFNKVFRPIIFSARSRVHGSTCELQTSLSDNCSTIGADLVHLSCAHSDSIQCTRMVAGPSDISGNRPLGPENSSPTSDRLSDVKFGTNLDVLAEIIVRENHYWKSDQSQDSLQNDQSTGYRSVSICIVFTLYLP